MMSWDFLSIVGYQLLTAIVVYIFGGIVVVSGTSYNTVYAVRADALTQIALSGNFAYPEPVIVHVPNSCRRFKRKGIYF